MTLSPTPEHAGIAIVAVLGFWILGAHNRLVRLRQSVKSAFAQVDEPLRQRHELLAEVIDAAAPLRADEAELLDALEAARQAARGAADQVAQRTLQADRIARLLAAENALRAEASRLITRIKADAGLRGDERLRAALKSLSATQQRLAVARDAFNAEVRVHNGKLRQFPTRLVAAMFGFGEASEL